MVTCLHLKTQIALLSLAENPLHKHRTNNVHTHTQQFNGRWSGTIWVSQYQKKHSPTHTHPDHRTSFINFLHLLWSIASSVFSLRAWQSSLTTSLQVLFGLPLRLEPSTSYSTHFFTQSLSHHKQCTQWHRKSKLQKFMCYSSQVSLKYKVSLKWLSKLSVITM